MRNNIIHIHYLIITFFFLIDCEYEFHSEITFKFQKDSDGVNNNQIAFL